MRVTATAAHLVDQVMPRGRTVSGCFRYQSGCAGCTELIFTPLELIDRLAHLLTPPRVHKHRYCGVLAPNAKLRRTVSASAGLRGRRCRCSNRRARRWGYPTLKTPVPARCWALLLARICECLPLVCPQYRSDYVWGS